MSPFTAQRLYATLAGQLPAWLAEADMEEYVTTVEAAELLRERGIDVKVDTIKHWCHRGKFPKAISIGSGRRSYWLIPRADILNFEPSGPGRPRSENPSRSALSHRRRREKEV